MNPSIINLRFIFILTLLASFLTSCKEDNFPSSPAVTIENDTIAPVYPGFSIKDYCRITLDSTTIYPTGYLNNDGYIFLHWFGKVTNTSENIVNNYITLSAKVYSDSTKKDIITIQTYSISLYNFKPGENYLFEIQTYNEIDTIKYPHFYPDSVFVN